MDVVLFSEKQIKRRILELSMDISGKINLNDDVVFVCVLRGSYMFFSDLMKELPGNVSIDFIQASSYSGRERGELEIKFGGDKDYTGKTIVLVDDIVDSGNTLLKLKTFFMLKNAKQIHIVTLLARSNNGKYLNSKYLADFYGFEIKDEWVWGYGMDLDGKFRNIPNIMYKEQNID